MIKFNTPEIKAQKIKDSIEILKKLKIQNSSLYGTVTTTPYVANNTIGNIFPQTVNTNIVGSCTTTTTSTTTLGLGLSNSQSQLVLNNNTNNSIVSSSITTGSTPNTIGTNTLGTTILGNNTIYGSYISNTLFQSKYTLLGSDIVLPYLYNGEMIVSLINTLGIDFWDEYLETVDFELNNKESFDIIEGVMKLQRRDAKLDSIINDK